jgi:hypothetical protein
LFLLSNCVTFIHSPIISSPPIQFIGTDTRKKIVFLNERHRQEQLSEIMSVDQAAPWMLDGGYKTKEFDSNRYLKDTPFDDCFDP